MLPAGPDNSQSPHQGAALPQRDTPRCGDEPSNVLPVPNLDAEGWLAGNVRIGQLPKQFVYSEVCSGGSAPEAFAFASQLFE
jgi:hypothetical protein